MNSYDIERMKREVENLKLKNQHLEEEKIVI